MDVEYLKQCLAQSKRSTGSVYYYCYFAVVATILCYLCGCAYENCAQIISSGKCQIPTNLFPPSPIQ